MDTSRLVRRRPNHVVVRLGEPFQPLVQARVGHRFSAASLKERDLVLDLPARREP